MRGLAERLARAARRWRLRRALEREEAEATRPLAIASVHRRLEMVLGAMYERPFHVEGAADPKPPSLLMRALGQRTPAPPLATYSGETIRLPQSIAAASNDEALAKWRLLAMEQAERAVRGSGAVAIGAADALERTLFALAEGVCVDHALASRTRTGAEALREARGAALAKRPPETLLPAAERDVERLITRVLAMDPTATPGDSLPDPSATPDESFAWAQATAARLRAKHGDAFRAVLPVSHWGVLPEGTAALAARVEDAQSMLPPMPFGSLQGERISRDGRRPDEVVAIPDPGTTSLTHVEAPIDDAGERIIRTPDDSEPAQQTERPPDSAAPPLGSPMDPAMVQRSDVARIGYPEWDALAGAYRPHGATVVLARAPESDDDSVNAFVRDNAVLLRRVRARFEPLRAQRARLARQSVGDELDIAACVDAYADLRVGRPPDDRLYLDVRPARRALAIAIVVDVSGSTDAPVESSALTVRQIIDVEKEALVVASEALEALGDPFTVLTFSSRGAHAVRLTTIKAFDEPTDSTVRRRIAAMRPTGNTRLGAAVRHATALLARQPVGHRLLLLLSDGRPNDADGYQGPYATEDARRAVVEARATGVHPFCLTVDREEAEYLPHIFGPGGHTLLRHVNQLPLALVGAVRQLLGAGR